MPLKAHARWSQPRGKRASIRFALLQAPDLCCLLHANYSMLCCRTAWADALYSDEDVCTTHVQPSALRGSNICCDCSTCREIGDTQLACSQATRHICCADGVIMAAVSQAIRRTAQLSLAWC